MKKTREFHDNESENISGESELLCRCGTIYNVQSSESTGSSVGGKASSTSEAGNKLCAQVTGKRKREVGLLVSAKFTALTSELRIARILERGLTARAEKYSQFEPKNITCKENQLPMLF